MRQTASKRAVRTTMAAGSHDARYFAALLRAWSAPALPLPVRLIWQFRPPARHCSRLLLALGLAQYPQRLLPTFELGHGCVGVFICYLRVTHAHKFIGPYGDLRVVYVGNQGHRRGKRLPWFLRPAARPKGAPIARP